MSISEPFIIRTLATWFGCGRAPKAPGTFGTLGAIPLFILFAQLQPISYMLATFAFAVFSILVAHAHENIFQEHDASEVVIDEVAGLLVTMTWIPCDILHIAAGVVLFRIFDILKPFPISYVDKKVKGGVGAVGDDLVAGILSNIILQVMWQKGVF
jgi:phosphatidylglycerophosphatase A